MGVIKGSGQGSGAYVLNPRKIIKLAEEENWSQKVSGGDNKHIVFTRGNFCVEIWAAKGTVSVWKNGKTKKSNSMSNMSYVRTLLKASNSLIGQRYV